MMCRVEDPLEIPEPCRGRSKLNPTPNPFPFLSSSPHPTCPNNPHTTLCYSTRNSSRSCSDFPHHLYSQHCSTKFWLVIWKIDLPPPFFIPQGMIEDAGTYLFLYTSYTEFCSPVLTPRFRYFVTQYNLIS